MRKNPRQHAWVPLEDYLILQTTLAEATAYVNLDESELRFKDIFGAIFSVKDIDVVASCLANLIASLHRVESKFNTSRFSTIETEARGKLNLAIDEILVNTAEQVYALKDVISALAIADGQYCLALCKRLNTVERRDEALGLLLTALESGEPSSVDLTVVGLAFGTFVNNRDRADAYVKLLAWIYSASSKMTLDGDFLERSKPLLGMSNQLQGKEEKALCCGFGAAVLAKGDSARGSKLHTHLLDSGYEAWIQIDDEHNKVEIGFDLAGILAEHHREKARAYLNEAAQIRKTGALSFMHSSQTTCLRLGIRAFKALVLNYISDDEDLQAIRSRVKKIASKYIQIAAWTDTALIYFQSGREGQGKFIVNNEIYPLLHGLKQQDESEWERAICAAAPALVCTNIDTGLELIGSLSYGWKDFALSSVLRFLFNKLAPTEPIDSSGEEKFRLTYGEARDACRVLRLFNADSMLYLNLESLLTSLRWKENNRNFTEQQKVQICSEIESLIATALPNSAYVTHEGYALISTAQLLRTRKARDQDWETLITKARSVPNSADRVYVLATVAKLYSGKNTKIQSELWNEAESLTKGLPCLVDRIERYHLIATEAELIDLEFSKRCLRAAMKERVRDEDGEEAWRGQRRIVDTAHRFSPELASVLASEIDDDEARVALKASLRNRVKVLDYKKDLSKAGSGPKATLEKTKSTSDAARMALGSLNANRTEPVQLAELQEQIYATSIDPIGSAYNMFSFAIENASKSYRKSSTYTLMLKGVFEATMRGCDLAEQLTGHKSARLQKSGEVRRGGGLNSTLVRAGERDRGLEIIQRWIEDNASDYLYISDPYIGPDELALVMRMVLRARTPLQISALTSKLHQRDEKVLEPFENSYKAHWSSISDQEAPDTLLLIVGLRSSKKSPIHPRWWLTKGAGMRVDTSLRSLGGPSDSEIFPLNQSELDERTAELQDYFELRKREHNGERLEITTFTLP
jgi:hypothetical protein